MRGWLWKCSVSPSGRSGYQQNSFGASHKRYRRLAWSRRGHVFVIRQVLGGGKVLACDANSGGRRTRLHVRSLAGFVVLNPQGGAG